MNSSAARAKRALDPCLLGKEFLHSCNSSLGFQSVAQWALVTTDMVYAACLCSWSPPTQRRFYIVGAETLRMDSARGANPAISEVSRTCRRRHQDLINAGANTAEATEFKPSPELSRLGSRTLGTHCQYDSFRTIPANAQAIFLATPDAFPWRCVYRRSCLGRRCNVDNHYP